jgi:site-specific DNA-methyltransferase (adenine-specific)/site-specific DNA-methyltransferase (cytosine-N4-specific)
MREIEDGGVDLWMTSPPYAKQRDYNGAESSEYIDFIAPVVKLAMEKLSIEGSLVLNIKEHVKNGRRDLYVLKMVIYFVETLGLTFVDEYIWVKTNPFPTGAKTRFKDGYERCLHFTNGKHQFFPEQCLAKSTSKWAESDKRRKNKGKHVTTNGSGMNMSKRVVTDMVRPSNVITGTSSNKNIGHPAVYPVYLPEFFIKAMTNKGDVVGDMFMGSGTTGVACANLNRDFIGIEMDLDYFNIAQERIEKAHNTQKQWELDL